MSRPLLDVCDLSVVHGGSTGPLAAAGGDQRPLTRGARPEPAQYDN
jgi:hypothetical protein